MASNHSRNPRLSRVRSLFKAACLIAPALIAAGCRENPVASIQLMTGESTDQQMSFLPKSSFAEYVELTTGGDELRITLANYELNCDTYTPNPEGGVLVVLTFLLPVGQHPVVGAYPWPGLPRGEKSADANFDLKSPVVMPVIRIGKRSIPLLPGGNVDIQRLNLERQGEVSGAMRLEQSGGNGQPPTRLFGSFTARVCRTTIPAGSVSQ